MLFMSFEKNTALESRLKETGRLPPEIENVSCVGTGGGHNDLSCLKEYDVHVNDQGLRF
jgi:hypothetical protein